MLSSEPLCHYCTEAGRTTVATVVDHTVPVKERPDLAFDPTNLKAVCAPCHSGFIQSWEKTGVRPGCGTDGVPSDEEHPWNKP